MPPAFAPTVLERALVWYARSFPVARGKLRLVNAAWPLAAGADPRRTAALVYGGFKAPADLRDMLQRQFYFFGTYYLERELLACWSALAREAQVVFDVGANAGIYSLAALAANPAAQVHAFEPTPEIAARLRATATLNGLSGLHVQESAISNHSGQASLVRFRGEDDSNEGMNFIRTDVVDPLSEQVRIESLDDFCAAAGIDRIDLMKIDIQGNEADALRGAHGLLAAGRIGTIFLELNWGRPDGACPASEAIAILDAHGYQFRPPTGEAQWRPAGPWLSSSRIADIIAGHVEGAAEA